MTKELDDSVSQGEEGWNFVCPRPEGCGDGGVPFSSTKWATKKAATDRGRQHLGEHDGDGPMPSLYDYEASLAEN